MELDNKNASFGNIIRSSSSSKKLQKQKTKVPQRGLGVAQLEKIRLQDQQNKKDFKSPSPPQQQPIPFPTYHSYSSIPDISSPNSILRLQNNINSNFNALQPPNKIWNSSSEFNLEKENCEVIDPGLALSNPIWPLHTLMQRSHFHQSPPSMMNVSSRSSSSSSLLNLHMELPSNQNNSYAVSLWPEEDKMVGMKRSYPFALENTTTTTGPSYHCKLPTIIHPFGRSEETTSFAINGATILNPNFRSCDWKKNKKENGDFNGDFLTLGPPPTTSLTSPNSKLQTQTHHLLPFHHSETFDFSSLPYQGNIEDEIDQETAGTSVGNGVQPFYSFLPPAIIQIGQTITTCNGAADFGDNVIDLSLRL
ncbi:uncharacterized protein [Euphorbia lathyris]|uniref:uncharacterized protein n=1 Tax=Euphorbia lathyris TaxID=212925 RepID=UPI003314377E